MFTPNSRGMIYRKAGRDVHGRVFYGSSFECPFSPVNLEARAEKTDRRADSSASRGAADEVVSWASVLIVPYVEPRVDDKFEFSGAQYLITAIHPRRTVFGQLDHYECRLEVLPV